MLERFGRETSAYEQQAQVSVEHLDRYLAQFNFLYTYCKVTDSERMRLVIDNAFGRRLSYKPLIGDVE